jgi:hypothetical protein
MADLVFAAALSHGPLLATPPEQWTVRADADRANQRLWFRGEALPYDTLLARRTDVVERYTIGSSEPERIARHGACQFALDELAQRFADACVDVAIIVGNDQREMFTDEVRPAALVLGAPVIPNVPLSAEEHAKLPPGVGLAEEGHCPPQGAEYPGHPDAALVLLKSLMSRGIDASWSSVFPTHGNQRGIPHAFGFVYRRLMRDVPPPTVPFCINSGIDPNKPTASRCFDYGPALLSAVDAMPDGLRVALVASGGLSHFVVDEDFDAQIMDAIKNNDLDAWRSIDESMYEGNSGEIKNWIPVASAAMSSHLTVQQADYVACVRTEAGTGSGMAFIAWS